MRYDDEAYKEVFPRKEVQVKPNEVESACETFRPSENIEQLNNESTIDEEIQSTENNEEVE